ncbi:hypothetical protein GGI17_006541 [Coemansia sp. S146]|nr:hypothetical protein GGI17_006541 [Coemansia sp. S146]
MLNLRSVSGLTSIIQGVGMVCAPFAQLVYCNAVTLEKLDLRNVDEDDWRILVCSGTKTPAVYSSMTALFVTLVDAPHGTTWTVIEDAVPFPALHEWQVFSSYPFNDDLLFRGNGRSLWKLGISFQALARNVLGRFNVFGGSGTKRMNLIIIDSTDDVAYAPTAEQAGTHIVQQVHSILQATTTLYLIGDTYSTHVLDAIKTAPTTAAIQGLELWDQPHDSCEILSIIPALPILTTLTCHMQGSASSIEAIHASEHSIALCKKYHLEQQR